MRPNQHKAGKEQHQKREPCALDSISLNPDSLLKLLVDAAATEPLEICS